MLHELNPAKVIADEERASIIGRLADEALSQIRERALEDFHFFTELTVSDNVGVPLKQAVIHRVWHAHVMSCWEHGRIPALFAPFDHGKSYQICVILTAWLLAHDVNIRAKIVCNNDDRAMERVMGISTVLRSPMYRLLFPWVREVPKNIIRTQGKQARWTQHEIFIHRPGFSLDPSVQAAGVMSGGTGGRCDLLILDDIVDQKNAIDEPKLRDKVAESVDNVWVQRAEPTAKIALVGTMWHQADYHHRILDRSGWCTLRQFISEDFERIDQELFNPFNEHPLFQQARLERKRRTNGTRRVAA